MVRNDVKLATEKRLGLFGWNSKWGKWEQEYLHF